MNAEPKYLEGLAERGDPNGFYSAVRALRELEHAVIDAAIKLHEAATRESLVEFHYENQLLDAVDALLQAREK